MAAANAPIAMREALMVTTHPPALRSFLLADLPARFTDPPLTTDGLVCSSPAWASPCSSSPSPTSPSASARPPRRTWPCPCSRSGPHHRRLCAHEPKHQNPRTQRSAPPSLYVPTARLLP
jgi:hypothetical protein